MAFFPCSLSLSFTFSVLHSATHSFHIILFTFNQMARCYLSCGVGCGIGCLCYVSKRCFFLKKKGNQMLFCHGVKWNTTNIFISSGCKRYSRYYTGIKFCFIIPQVWCLNWNHIVLRVHRSCRIIKLHFFNQDSQK